MGREWRLDDPGKTRANPWAGAHLKADKLIVDVALAMEVGKDLEGLLRAAVVHEVAGGLGEEEHSDREEDSGDELKEPGNAEGVVAGD